MFVFRSRRAMVTRRFLFFVRCHMNWRTIGVRVGQGVVSGAAVVCGYYVLRWLHRQIPTLSNAQTSAVPTLDEMHQANRLLHEEWTKRVAEREGLHGKYDLRVGGKDYQSQFAWKDACRRYTSACPYDPSPTGV